jgi:hypothetical protein
MMFNRLEWRKLIPPTHRKKLSLSLSLSLSLCVWDFGILGCLDEQNEEMKDPQVVWHLNKSFKLVSCKLGRSSLLLYRLRDSNQSLLRQHAKPIKIGTWSTEIMIFAFNASQVGSIRCLSSHISNNQDRLSVDQDHLTPHSTVDFLSKNYVEFVDTWP